MYGIIPVMFSLVESPHSLFEIQFGDERMLLEEPELEQKLISEHNVSPLVPPTCNAVCMNPVLHRQASKQLSHALCMLKTPWCRIADIKQGGKGLDEQYS